MQMLDLPLQELSTPGQNRRRRRRRRATGRLQFSRDVKCTTTTVSNQISECNLSEATQSDTVVQDTTRSGNELELKRQVDKQSITGLLLLVSITYFILNVPHYIMTTHNTFFPHPWAFWKVTLSHVFYLMFFFFFAINFLLYSVYSLWLNRPKKGYRASTARNTKGGTPFLWNMSKCWSLAWQNIELPKWFKLNPL